MTTSFKTPPIWVDDQPFHAWKNEVSMWEKLTDLPKEKQGLAVALSLTGRKREVAMELAPDVLGAQNGLVDLMNELASVFGKDSVDIAFENYCN